MIVIVCPVRLSVTPAPSPKTTSPSSGVLSFFVAAAKPVITTPFAYAASLLPKDFTTFVPVKNSQAITQAIERYMIDKVYYEAIRTKLFSLR